MMFDFLKVNYFVLISIVVRLGGLMGLIYQYMQLENAEINVVGTLPKVFNPQNGDKMPTVLVLGINWFLVKMYNVIDYIDVLPKTIIIIACITILVSILISIQKLINKEYSIPYLLVFLV